MADEETNMYHFLCTAICALYEKPFLVAEQS